MESTIKPELASSSAEKRPTTRIGDRVWASYHLYYPGDRNRVLLDFVLPLAGRLLAEQRIDSFFFIRYADQGGPHVRLRLRLLNDDLEPLEDRVRQQAASFFRRWKGADALTEALQGTHPAAGSYEPIGVPAGLKLDILKGVPFEPEVERYGGTAVLGHSLDLFALSSVHALSFVVSYGEYSRARRLSLAMSLLLWQACGFAAELAELLSLLDYFSDRRQRMADVVAAADRAFDERREAFRLLLASGIERFLEAGRTMPTVSLCTAASLSTASRCLSISVRSVDRQARHSIGTSQMHMTANRLGLTNQEESYVTQLLWRGVVEMAARDPETWARLRSVLTERAEADSPGAPGAQFSALFPELL